jgi:hypothetical protein
MKVTTWDKYICTLLSQDNIDFIEFENGVYQEDHII